MKTVFISKHLADILRKIAYSCLIVLCVVNVFFFITQWNDIQITLSTEGVLLSVVGFFFAFAGINLYSIFNTNVETEKQNIRDLAEQYKNALQIDSMLLKFPKEMIKIFHRCQYITSAVSFQFYSFDSLMVLKTLLNDQHAFIQSLKDNGKTDAYEQCLSDSREMAKCMWSLLKDHRKKLEYNGFFQEHKAEEDNYKRMLDDLIIQVENIQSDNYDNLAAEVVEPRTLCEKIAEVYQFAKQVFK